MRESFELGVVERYRSRVKNISCPPYPAKQGNRGPGPLSDDKGSGLEYISVLSGLLREFGFQPYSGDNSGLSDTEA